MTFPRAHYDALTAGVGFAELRNWTQIELTGADRVKFLNNFCTADLQKLSPDQGSEAFICNVKGKVLGHVWIVNHYDRLILITVPGQAETLVPHLERYTLRDDVALRDISAETRLIQLAGDAAEPFLGQSLAPQHNDRPLEQNLPERWLETGNCLLAGDIPCFVTRGLLGPTCLLLHVGEFLAAEVVEYFRSQGAVRCDDSALDAVRIEAGVPLYGCDITADNLPQEVNRNAQAISFTKGCYLGQETVARIDALGHVNRLLVGIQCFGGEVPVAGEPLFAEGKEIGQVTSAAFSPRLQSPLALAYVRSSHAEPGTKLASPHGTAQVIALPLT